MTSHYDTLGVPPDATQAEIRAAYRRMSSAAHPDKEGGSNERMAEINRAYEALRDPDRRTRYDATGDGAEQTPIDVEARDVLLHIFREVMGQGDLIVQSAKNAVASTLASVDRERARFESRKQDLLRRRAKVRTKDGSTNLVHALIDQEVATVEGQANAMTHRKVVLAKITEILEQYDEDRPPPPSGSDFERVYMQIARGQMGSWGPR